MWGLWNRILQTEEETSEKKTENTSDFLGLLLQLVKKDLKMVTETLIKQKTFPFKHKHFVESPDEQRQRRDTR